MADRFGYGEIGLDIHPCRGCEDYEPPDGCKTHGGCAKPITNADRIRAMSDEDLAEYIRVFFPEVCPPGNCPGEDYCYKCWLDWLRSPADGCDGDES